MLFREDQHEALTAVHVAGAIEHRNIYHLGCRGCKLGRRQHADRCYGETISGPTVSKTSWTHVRTLPGPRSSPSCPAVEQDRLEKAEDAII